MDKKELQTRLDKAIKDLQDAWLFNDSLTFNPAMDELKQIALSLQAVTDELSKLKDVLGSQQNLRQALDGEGQLQRELMNQRQKLENLQQLTQQALTSTLGIASNVITKRRFNV